MLTNTTIIRPSLAALILCGLSGCYAGHTDHADHADHADPGGPNESDAGSTSSGTPADSDAGSDGGDVSQCGDQLDVGPTPLRRLTRLQYNNAIRDLLGVSIDSAIALPQDETLGPFAANLSTSMTDLQVEQYSNVAELAANDALADRTTFMSCDPNEGAELDCIEAFVSQFGPRAFRRPLNESQRQRYINIYQSMRNEGDDVDQSLATLIAAMLQSPLFLYHVELPPGDAAPGSVAPLGQYALASRLSFFLWNSIPDDELFEAADDGTLSTNESLRDQTLRMLEDPRAEATTRSFHIQWLGLTSSLDKDPEQFPNFSPELAEAMLDETARFADYVIRKDDGRLETLLTASYSLLSGPLFDHYGLTSPLSHDVTVPVELDPTQRAGILTQASFLASHAHFDQTSPVGRGAFVRERLLCQTPPPPPPDLEIGTPQIEPGSTVRESLKQHREDPTCAGCHVLFDPLGLGFEHYDATGVWRDTEAGQAVDASGEIIATVDIDGSFDGAIELGARLAQSEQVAQCVTDSWMQFGLGRGLSDHDECSVTTVHDQFVSSDKNIRDLLVAIVTSDAFQNYRSH